MYGDIQLATTPQPMLWTGRILSALVALALFFSGIMKIVLPPDAVKGFENLGWPTSAALGLAIVEIGSAVLYLIPQTTVLGAILIAGYLGGAVATHVRIGEYSEMAAPIIIGVLAWLGLWLREARLREITPWRR
jgi:hypothetical protein